MMVETTANDGPGLVGLLTDGGLAWDFLGPCISGGKDWGGADLLKTQKEPFGEPLLFLNHHSAASLFLGFWH